MQVITKEIIMNAVEGQEVVLEALISDCARAGAFDILW